MRGVRVMFTIYVALIVAGLGYAIALGILEH
ncbi:MAG: hypothetical protein QOJ89_1182 [bacterium]|jgi:hypothetical protein